MNLTTPSSSSLSSSSSNAFSSPSPSSLLSPCCCPSSTTSTSSTTWPSSSSSSFSPSSSSSSSSSCASSLPSPSSSPPSCSLSQSFRYSTYPRRQPLHLLYRYALRRWENLRMQRESLWQQYTSLYSSLYQTPHLSLSSSPFYLHPNNLSRDKKQSKEAESFSWSLPSLCLPHASSLSSLIAPHLLCSPRQEEEEAEEEEEDVYCLGSGNVKKKERGVSLLSLPREARGEVVGPALSAGRTSDDDDDLLLLLDHLKRRISLVEAECEEARRQWERYDEEELAVIGERERQEEDIFHILRENLSEPYTMETIRYLLHGWPHLAFLAYDGETCAGVCLCKIDKKRRRSPLMKSGGHTPQSSSSSSASHHGFSSSFSADQNVTDGVDPSLFISSSSSLSQYRHDSESVVSSFPQSTDLSSSSSCSLLEEEKKDASLSLVDAKGPGMAAETLDDLDAVIEEDEENSSDEDGEGKEEKEGEDTKREKRQIQEEGEQEREGEERIVWKGYIAMLAVRSAYRRKGIGRTLVSKALDEMRKKRSPSSSSLSSSSSTTTPLCLPSSSPQSFASVLPPLQEEKDDVKQGDREPFSLACSSPREERDRKTEERRETRQEGREGLYDDVHCEKERAEEEEDLDFAYEEEEQVYGEVESCRIETETTNFAALSLYESVGFTRVKHMRRFYMNGSDAYKLRLSFAKEKDQSMKASQEEEIKGDHRPREEREQGTSEEERKDDREKKRELE
ncbi:gnat family protein [Cystoisospora suis]|uniref:Gnat family protein n=1 Tax=Cystoisospora suis TaxID=483139 RepID=A0A2C6LAL4_9APIC|nr:gnat family protein [Cystoisospora suis]